MSDQVGAGGQIQGPFLGEIAVQRQKVQVQDFLQLTNNPQALGQFRRPGMADITFQDILQGEGGHLIGCHPLADDGKSRKDGFHPFRRRVEKMAGIAVIGEDEVTFVIDVTSVFQRGLHGTGGLKGVAQVFHHSHGKDKIEALRLERQGMDIGHHIHVGGQGNIHPDNVGDRQGPVSAPDLQYDLILPQGMEDSLGDPRVVGGPDEQLGLVLGRTCAVGVGQEEGTPRTIG